MFRKGIGNKILVLVISLVFLIICSTLLFAIKEVSKSEKINQTGVELYFMEMQTSLLKPERHELKSITNNENKGEILKETLMELKNGPKMESLVSTINEDISFLKINIDGNAVTVDVSEEYGNLTAGDELICRGSIIKTLTSLDFVEYAKITVNGKELLRTNNESIGYMKFDDIITNEVISPEPKNYETVKLYFANSDYTKLLEERRTIEVNPNEPIEKYVVEQLISGPKEENHYSTIPTETKIRSINTEKSDSMCYVDLSSEFVSRHIGGEKQELMTIYSIVNSLTNLETIKKVQFLIEGEKQNEFKGNVDFSKPFERNEKFFDTKD